MVYICIREREREREMRHIQKGFTYENHVIKTHNFLSRYYKHSVHIHDRRLMEAHRNQKEAT